MLCDLGALTGAVVVINMGEGPASWRVPEAPGTRAATVGQRVSVRGEHADRGASSGSIS